MIFLATLSLLAALAVTLPLIITPITLGIWVFLLAITAAALTALISSRWFRLILFIIYIRGILVIFSYFAATAPNQIIRVSLNYITFFVILIFLYVVIFNINIDFLPNLYLRNKPNLNSFSYLFSISQNNLLLFLAVLLLIALIFVVKIANRKGGPLRPFSP